MVRHHTVHLTHTEANREGEWSRRRQSLKGIREPCRAQLLRGILDSRRSESGDVDQEPSKGRTHQPASSRNPEALDEPSDQSGYRRRDYCKKLESQISSINHFQRLVFCLYWRSLIEICTPDE